MDRREFLRATSSLLLTAQLPAVQYAMGRSLSPQPTPTVYEVEKLSLETTRTLFEVFGGIRGLCTSDIAQATVLIKPNLCLSQSNDTGVTTSIQTVEFFCQALIDEGVKKIIIADHTLGQTADFQASDWYELPKKYPEVKFVLANEERMFEPRTVEGKLLKTIAVLKLLSRADLLLNIATAKHHSGTHVSLAVKNLMGCIWNRSDLHTKMDLHQAIGDLAISIRPTINIIDATRVLSTGGPVGPGRLLNENRLFASTDIVAVDSVVVSRYNFGGKSLPPNEIAHLQAAYQNGAGEIDLDKIKIERI
jgi:uncharacterized protein (DUF362 family)